MIDKDSFPDQVAMPRQRLADYLRILRRRWKLVVGVVVVVVGIAVAGSLAMSKKYDATASLLLNQSDQIDAIVTGRSQQSADPERDLNTNVSLIKVDRVAAQARSALGLNISPKALLDEVSTAVDGTSNIVQVTVRDSSPDRAAAIANAVAVAYVDFRRADAQAPLESAAAETQAEIALVPASGRSATQAANLAAQLQSLKTAARLQTGGAEIVSEATVPAAPSRPRPLLSGVVGLILGLLLAFGGAFALEVLDRRLKDDETAEAVLGLSVVGAIPRPRPRSGERDDPGQQEAYGLLAASLRFSALSADFGTLMVTSAGPGEGKTSVTLGLARALALLGERVIAIEADLRRPSFGEYLSTPASAGGLAAALRAPAQFQSKLVWIDAATLKMTRASAASASPSFRVLPAGPLPANPVRALARPSLEKVITAARDLADVVLIDTAPVGTVSDAASLLKHVDGVIVIVQLGKTTKDAARRTVRLLTNFDVAIPGMVLTAVPQAAGGYYGYAPSEEPAQSPK
jgi:capsular exopolysaccharide synthesis family protein